MDGIRFALLSKGRTPYSAPPTLRANVATDRRRILSHCTWIFFIRGGHSAAVGSEGRQSGIHTHGRKYDRDSIRESAG